MSVALLSYVLAAQNESQPPDVFHLGDMMGEQEKLTLILHLLTDVSASRTLNCIIYVASNLPDSNQHVLKD